MRPALLHRDIKAQNVMAGEDGRLVLMDFGAGTKLGGAEMNIAGTPLYLAPEVLSGATPRPSRATSTASACCSTTC